MPPRRLRSNADDQDEDQPEMPIVPPDHPLEEPPEAPFNPPADPLDDLDIDPNHHSAMTSDEEPNLARALTLLTEQLRSRDKPKRVKAKEPDTFDGSDSRKLNNFILLCNLYFRHNPSYEEDATKVTFALSYLRGTALEYFEPAILESDDYFDWMDNWSAFLRTLRTQFGPIDPTGDAENGIDYLRMQDGQRIVKYNVEFNRLSVRTGWDDSVLRHRYYTGLAERIKDVMGQQGKPTTLDGMKVLAHTIDARHWERLRERSRSGKAKSDDKSDKPDNNKFDKSNKTDDKAKHSSGFSGFKGKNKPDYSNRSAKAGSSSGSSNPLADKLGKDGKLTHQERQRRFDNNLCMFCGGLGHIAKDCPKSSSSSAKARAAKLKEKEPAATDSKKS